MRGIESAKNITSPIFLKNNLGKMKYSLVEVNFLNGKEIISTGNIEDAKVVGSAVKCCGNYLFKLYVWE